jgi:hypothetical protein
VVHRSALIEEMDFWRSPYAIDKEIVRRSGPVLRKPRPLPGTTPHAEQLRKNRELLAAAQAEEHQRLVHKQIEQLLRDIEWERASAPFGRVVNRHYVPQWQLDERIDAKNERAKKWFGETKLAIKTRRDEDQRQREEDREALKRAHQQALAKETLERLRLDDQQQQERRRALAEHRETLERLRQMMPHPVPTESINPQRGFVKGRIMAILRDAFPNMVTLDALHIAMPDVDKELVMQCAEEMAGNGRIKKAAS